MAKVIPSKEMSFIFTDKIGKKYTVKSLVQDYDLVTDTELLDAAGKMLFENRDARNKYPFGVKVIYHGRVLEETGSVLYPPPRKTATIFIVEVKADEFMFDD